MKKIVGFGELMLSLEPAGYRRFIQADSMECFFTGAESNVCASLAQYGMPAELVTRLPENPIADAAIASLRKFGIGTDAVARGGERIGVIYTERGASGSTCYMSFTLPSSLSRISADLSLPL